MSELHRIGSQQREASADVVFVHGLGGHWRDTWAADAGAAASWPVWVAEDEAHRVNVWAAEYAAQPSAWLGPSMPIVDCAIGLLDRLAQAGIGARPLVFVTHSLGGLVVKQILRRAGDAGVPRWRAVLDATRAICFLGTPHAGSDVASYLKGLARSFGLMGAGAALLGWPVIGALAQILLRNARTTRLVRELEANDPYLADLNAWYRQNAAALGIETVVYFETQPTRGILIVDRASSDPGMTGLTPVPLPLDHATICKPSNLEAQVVVAVRRLIGVAIDRGVDPEVAQSPMPKSETTILERPAASLNNPIHTTKDKLTRLQEFTSAGLIHQDVSKDIQKIIVLEDLGFGGKA